MTFTVPNEATAGYTDQAEIDSGDLTILAGGLLGTGVISGCGVTQQAVPDDTVVVASGTYFLGGTKKTCAGGTVNVMSGSANADGTTTSAADTNYFRYDLIVINTSAQLGVLHGTVPAPAWPDYAVNPVFPTASTSTYVVLAAILVPPTSASITGIATAQIVQKGVVIDREHSIISANNHTTGWGGKGYLLHGLTTSTGGAVAPGTNGQMLTAQSGQTSGLAYADYFTVASFGKQGIVAVTTEGDTPPPFRWYNDTGRTLTFASARASATIGPNGSTSIVDINVDGTTIMSGTKVVLADGSGAAATTSQTTFSTTTVATGHYVSVNVDTAGGGAMQNLLVTVWMKN